MNTATKTLFIVMMTAGLLFGFLHAAAPDHNFERLHIFLFNLCSGGTLILIHTEGKRRFTAVSGSFFALSILYALCAYFKQYIPAIAIALVLAVLVEITRIRRFSVFPVDFFRISSPVPAKFHQASLLCLSMGLVISSLVILNQEFYRVFSSPKLTLDIFFLGFSFPVSLITMSLMFGMMEERKRPIVRILKEYSFWAVNLGVIFFFLFILLQMTSAELAISISLFVTVILIFFLYMRLGIRKQPMAFLSSGMAFLIMTAVTGIAYILLYAHIPQPPNGKLLLKLHALISLYGWNLNGLAVICRYHDFPIRLNSMLIILFHWVIVLLIAPLGLYSTAFSFAAVVTFCLFLSIVFFTRGRDREVKKTGAA